MHGMWQRSDAAAIDAHRVTRWRPHLAYFARDLAAEAKAVRRGDNSQRRDHQHCYPSHEPAHALASPASALSPLTLRAWKLSSMDPTDGENSCWAHGGSTQHSSVAPTKTSEAYCGDSGFSVRMFARSAEDLPASSRQRVRSLGVPPMQDQALACERRSHSSRPMRPTRASPNGTSERSSTRPPQYRASGSLTTSRGSPTAFR